MSLRSILNDLNEFPFFGGVRADALEKMDDLFACGTYAVGEHLIDEGTRGNRLYILVSGKVEVSMRLDRGEGQGERVLALATLGRGESFGEMELIDTQDRSATVVAVEPTETLELTNMGFLEIFKRDADVFRMMMMNLARDLSRRLRAADRRMAEYLATGKLPPRRNSGVRV